MKGPSFRIHRTCLHHWVFELPLSHLSPCSAIHFIFLTLWVDALSSPQLCVCRLSVLSLHYVICALTRMLEVVIFKFSNPHSPVLCIWPSLILLYANVIFVFPSCPIYPWNEKPWSWSGTHSSAKVWGSCCAFSNIWVVQGWEKVSLVLWASLSYVEILFYNKISFIQIHPLDKASLCQTSITASSWFQCPLY